MAGLDLRLSGFILRVPEEGLSRTIQDLAKPRTEVTIPQFSGDFGRGTPVARQKDKSAGDGEQKRDRQHENRLHHAGPEEGRGVTEDEAFQRLPALRNVP